MVNPVTDAQRTKHWPFNGWPLLNPSKNLLVSFGLRIIRKREKEVNESLTEPGEKQAIWFPLLPLDLISFYPFSPRTCLHDFLLSASAFSCRKIYHEPLANMSTLRRQWQCAFLSLPDVISPEWALWIKGSEWWGVGVIAWGCEASGSNWIFLQWALCPIAVRLNLSAH